MYSLSLTSLRAVLVLAGAFTAFTGINIAFGGIPTLGWQGVAAFFEVTNERAFFVQDSHVRFLGGVWIGVGLILAWASANPKKHRGLLNAVFALIFLGGLARLTQMHPEVTLGADILGSFLAEVAGMPVLYFWLSAIARRAGSREAMPAASNGSSDQPILPKFA